MRLRKKALPATSLEEMTEPDEETGGPRKDVGAPDLGLSGAVDRVNLQRAVEQLPPGYRTVFVLHDVQGYEHNEIADIMDCSVRPHCRMRLTTFRAWMGNQMTNIS